MRWGVRGRWEHTVSPGKPGGTLLRPWCGPLLGNGVGMGRRDVSRLRETDHRRRLLPHRGSHQLLRGRVPLPRYQRAPRPHLRVLRGRRGSGHGRRGRERLLRRDLRPASRRAAGPGGDRGRRAGQRRVPAVERKLGLGRGLRCVAGVLRRRGERPVSGRHGLPRIHRYARGQRQHGDLLCDLHRLPGPRERCECNRRNHAAARLHERDHVPVRVEAGSIRFSVPGDGRRRGRDGRGRSRPSLQRRVRFRRTVVRSRSGSLHSSHAPPDIGAEVRARRGSGLHVVGEGADIGVRVLRRSSRSRVHLHVPCPRRRRGDAVRRGAALALRRLSGGLHHHLRLGLSDAGRQSPAVASGRFGGPVAAPAKGGATPLVEAVPNFSEGRDSGFVSSVAEAFVRTGCDVLHTTRDPDHNRCVVTVVGGPRDVEAAAVAAARIALERIDLRRHRGVHPRVGALDVLPFVPLRGMEMAEAAALARRTAARIGRLGIPVYHYGRASDPVGRTLASIRRGGFEALLSTAAGRERADVPGLARDGTPAHLFAHPTAGATCVGAREVLLAWNVDVAGISAEDAATIAAAIRESGGGFRGLRAMALFLPRQGRTQLSMNLETPEVTDPMEVFAEIERRVAERGGRAVGTEVIGLVPDAITDSVARAMGIRDWSPHRILSRRVAARVAADNVR
ncbi:MAG: glutamate formimidoyltransferase [Gemmatimonadetes bacterium]|nr:glutamate formimidoyltransferase [Gemmatimonadota bacterium]MYB99382.1 glutamate formimidoyltransferase [Gemmatimonadota bacterium]MYI47306.1 glutamate formimidoyltransferase [Gemmatimonadota bacterium]